MNTHIFERLVVSEYLNVTSDEYPADLLAARRAEFVAEIEICNQIVAANIGSFNSLHSLPRLVDYMKRENEAEQTLADQVDFAEIDASTDAALADCRDMIERHHIVYGDGISQVTPKSNLEFGSAAWFAGVPEEEI
jgi:hypothetical protein